MKFGESRVSPVWIGGALLGALVACSSEADGPADPLPPPVATEGFQMAMTATAPAGEEIWLCQVSNIPTDYWMLVNRVESVQSVGMHHMDVMALAFTGVELEPGTYDCGALYEEHPALMEDGLIIYASQSPEQIIQLPEGIAANLPPGISIMQEIHYVNFTDEPVEVFSKVNAYDYPASKLVDTIWGGAVRDVDLAIPAGATHTEWTRCLMNEPVDLLFLSSHTHALGKRVSVNLFDGEAVGERIYENTDWQTPSLKSFGTTPLHRAAGQGVEFACEFDNPTQQDVTWGFNAADEMCQIALVYTPGEAQRACAVVDAGTGAR
jgi:hypothetical protein